MSNNISVNLPEDAFIHIDTTQRQSEIITRPGITFWADARRRLFRNRVAMTGLAVIVIITLLAIFVPIFRNIHMTSRIFPIPTHRRR